MHTACSCLLPSNRPPHARPPTVHPAFYRSAGHPPDKGLTQSQVEALPAMLLTEEAVAALCSSTCSVCLEELEVGETAR